VRQLLYRGVEPWMKSRANSDTEMAGQLWHQSSMHGSVAFRAEADEIRFRIFALAAPTLNVVDLEPGSRPAVLTSPAVSLQDLPAQRAVGIGTQPSPAGFC
jgi:hypothetical protein